MEVAEGTVGPWAIKVKIVIQASRTCQSIESIGEESLMRPKTVSVTTASPGRLLTWGYRTSRTYRPT